MPSFLLQLPCAAYFPSCCIHGYTIYSIEGVVPRDMSSQIAYSEKYHDDAYEYRLAGTAPPKAIETGWSWRSVSLLYRHVILPRDVAALVPKERLMAESEWRKLGVQQSRGWVHYMTHKPGEQAQTILCSDYGDRVLIKIIDCFCLINSSSEPHILLFRRPVPRQSPSH